MQEEKGKPIYTGSGAPSVPCVAEQSLPPATHSLWEGF